MQRVQNREMMGCDGWYWNFDGGDNIVKDVYGLRVDYK